MTLRLGDENGTSPGLSSWIGLVVSFLAALVLNDAFLAEVLRFTSACLGTKP